MLHELREKKNEQRAYRSDIRRIVSFIEAADLSEDMAHTLYEYKEMAKAIIADAKTTTAAPYARARAVLSRALRDVLEAISGPLNAPNMSCGHDKSANHLPITTLNPIRICSDFSRGWMIIIFPNCPTIYLAKSPLLKHRHSLSFQSFGTIMKVTGTDMVLTLVCGFISMNADRFATEFENGSKGLRPKFSPALQSAMFGHSSRNKIIGSSPRPQAVASGAVCHL